MPAVSQGTSMSPSGVGDARMEIVFRSPSLTLSRVATGCSRRRTSGSPSERNGTL
jgi:hypothetical protein